MPSKDPSPKARPVSTRSTKTTPEQPAEQEAARTTTKPTARKAAPKVKAASPVVAKKAIAKKTVATPRRPRATLTVEATNGSSVDRLSYSIEDEVRVRAYLLSLARGDRAGSPEADWFQAEQEVAMATTA